MSKPPVVKTITAVNGTALTLNGIEYAGTLLVKSVECPSTTVHVSIVPQEARRGHTIVLRKQAAIDLALAIIKECGE